MIHVLIAEDQAIVRNGLKMIIEQDEEIHVVAEAENGKEVLSLLEKTIVDIILMDIRMPIMDGMEATKRIRQQYPHIKILILTTFNDEEYAIQAFQEGANGFLLKTTDSVSLVNSIKSCLSGGISIHDQVAAKLMPKLLKKEAIQEKAFSHNHNIPLTKREIDIVKKIGQGKTNKEISSELLLSVGTIKNHITQILAKLELRDRTQLAIYAVRNDYI
ncbi:response regulator transcription factor [Niallia sp. Sow4_A1]|jgi:DNA-binding NarL/FixJ family response regulator|uniref:Response regulator transcription factor n=1 Tax=Niallia hominis TaxID=3133173 RepID=A0ABV1ETS9_9BACI|nr:MULTISPECIES: response regulator transcription factor [Bacillaceae]MCF2648351.1 response regulator transcription factor [Niallia circulans]MCM3363278.1 response regulator transcription factor [Niallia sp. MER TA 168]REB73274.1 DNA-binding response regulator [Cutibacterium acnes]CAI9394838.1 Transcriptional regulatory protein LnrK [Bacillus sp. T2.9-1]